MDAGQSFKPQRGKFTHPPVGILAQYRYCFKPQRGKFTQRIEKFRQTLKRFQTPTG